MLIGRILRLGLDIGGVADVVKVVGRDGYIMRGVPKPSKMGISAKGILLLSI